MSLQLIIFAILGLFVLLLIVLVIRLEVRFKRLLMGTGAKDLEGVMNTLGHHVDNLQKTQIEINKHLEVVDKRLAKSVRNIETIRFNPFPDAGSNQSFAIAMLNDEGDGVVISSLYARDRMSVFAKEIKKGASVQELSEEESDVLKKAK